MDRIPKVTVALRFAIQHRLAEILTYIIVFVSIGFGITLINHNKTLRLEDTYSLVVSWAPLMTWGTIIILLSLVLGLIAPMKKAEVAWVAMALTIIYGVFTIGTALAAGTGGLPTAIWGYMTLTLITGLISLIMALSEKIVDEMSPNGLAI